MDDTQLTEIYRLDRECILGMLISLFIFSHMLDLLLPVIVLVYFPNKWALFDATASASIFKYSLVKVGLR